MKRLLSVFLCFVLTVVFLSACNSKPADVSILSVENSASAALAHMIKKSENNNNYISSTVNLPNRVRNLMADGACDIAVIPIETASIIYQRSTTKIKVLAGISTGGFEFIVKEDFNDFSKLKGKTIYLTERGTIMENIFKYLIKQYGVDPFEDVSFEYASDAKQLEKMLINNQAEYAIMNSADAVTIKASTQNFVSLNLTDELAKKFNNPSIITYCVVATEDFINNNPKTVDNILKDIESSVSKAKTTTTTATSAKTLGLLTDDIYDENFIKECKPEYISGKSMKEKLSAYYKLIKKINSSLISNKIPKDDFYYIAEE